jgi:glycosyltransferase involved in cell wall biosynthesis
MNFYFWHRLVSPHMTALVVALAKAGHKVTYVAEALMSKDRSELGWKVPELDGVNLILVNSRSDVSRVISKAPPHSIHFCEGFRANGLISFVILSLISHKLKLWIIMEMVNDRGLFGFIKKLEYARLFVLRRKKIQGVLTIGYKTTDWIANLGIPNNIIFPFTYFIKRVDIFSEPTIKRNKFRFIFVGNLVQRKNLNFLIYTLSRVNFINWELLVVGQGVLNEELRSLGNQLLPGRIQWVGSLPIDEVPRIISNSDCLVLPSKFDGWGVVASEAIMVGTQVICSDSCGVAGLVQASTYGGVFQNANSLDLEKLLNRVLTKGPMDIKSRKTLAHWGMCITAKKGADYLLSILKYVDQEGEIPLAPWLNDMC